MKIGIFAGTFDPVHNGHLAFAEAAIEKAGLDKAIMVAEKEPYRKQPHVSWDHRQAMIERATEATEHVDHDYHFAAELSNQHTLANMLVVASKQYQDAEVWFLVGSDVLEHLGRWENLAKDSDYGGFIVALRHDHTEAWAEAQLAELQKRGLHPKIIVIKAPEQGLGSTTIRQQLAANQPAPALPKNVSDYIAQHGLYKEIDTLRAA